MTRRTFFLTVLTLIAFAANSVLCRMALKAELIDPVSFTQIRLFSGALFLAPFFYGRREALALRLAIASVLILGGIYFTIRFGERAG